MSDPLYAKPLLRLAALASGAGHLEPCDAAGAAHNPICGDRVRVTLQLDGLSIARLAHETEACVLTQASASILGAHLSGADKDAVEILRDQVAIMLQGGATPPAPFADYATLMGAVIHRNRHTCVLLPLDAVLDALSK